MSTYMSTSTDTPTVAGLLYQNNPKCGSCKLGIFTHLNYWLLKNEGLITERFLSYVFKIYCKCSISKMKCDNWTAKHATVMCLKNKKNILQISVGFSILF